MILNMEDSMFLGTRQTKLALTSPFSTLTRFQDSTP
ncbi:hypothetical protein LINPERHAP2_LOCUS32578 [Linum perenne]